MNIVRVLLLGDVVGEEAVALLGRRLPEIIRDERIDITIVNGENAAGGFGITAELLAKLFNAGADVVTGGNHTFEKHEFWATLDSEPRALRPANYFSAPGHGTVTITKKIAAQGDGADSARSAVSALVINLQGREFMQAIDCPFRSFDSIVATSDEKIIIVDFHAESTDEKEALGFYLDGRASVVAGTHTHVQTTDARVLPRGTAYISDLGMTGPVDSCIGMEKEICLRRVVTGVAYKMQSATGRVGIAGAIAELDADTGLALSFKAASW